MSLLPNEVSAPVIRYHSNLGITHNIGLYEKKTAPDAIGYLEHYIQPDKTQNIFKTLYIPYVATGNTAASDVRIHVNGTTYALRRRGIVEGTKTRWDISGQGAWGSSAINLRSGVRKEASSNSYNVRVYVKARSLVYLRAYKGGFSRKNVFYETTAINPPWLWESTPTFDRTFTWDGDDIYIELTSVKIGSDIRDRIVEVWR